MRVSGDRGAAMADRPKNVGDVLKMMKDKDVKFLDLRFTDTKGKMQHVTADGSCVNEAMFAEGYAFDGSSIAGWKGIEASDMTLMPDPAQRPHRSVLRPDHHGGVLRRARALDRRDVRARSALDRQARRGLHEADGRRRHRRVRPRGRVLHLRRRALHRRSLQHRLQARQRRAAVELRHRVRDGQPRPTARAPRAATSPCRRSTAPRTSAPRCSR